MLDQTLANSETNIQPDDILCALLVVAETKRPTQRLTFRGHDSELQDVFHKLVAQVDGKLLGRFVFSDRGPIPYSPILNQSISTLQLAGLIGRENPDYAQVFLQSAASTYYEEVLKKRFSTEELIEIDRAADVFLENITVV